MNELRVSIKELETLTYSEATQHCCERVVDMYLRLGEVQDAIQWKWKLVTKLQRGE